MTFAERLRELRKTQGLTQAELAALAGIHEPAVYEYEKGRLPSFPTIVRLAKALDTCVSAFGECELPPTRLLKSKSGRQVKVMRIPSTEITEVPA